MIKTAANKSMLSTIHSYKVAYDDEHLAMLAFLSQLKQSIMEVEMNSAHYVEKNFLFMNRERMFKRIRYDSIWSTNLQSETKNPKVWHFRS